MDDGHSCHNTTLSLGTASDFMGRWTLDYAGPKQVLRISIFHKFRAIKAS